MADVGRADIEHTARRKDARELGNETIDDPIGIAETGRGVGPDDRGLGHPAEDRVHEPAGRLGRDLDPKLDLWKTAKPYLQRWMDEQIGWRALARALKQEAPSWAAMLPQLPRLAHQLLAEDRLEPARQAGARLLLEQSRQSRALMWIAVLLALQLAVTLYLLLH